MNEFLHLPERIVEDNNADATRIYDVDETGLTVVKKKPRRVVSMKGRSKICYVSSGERGVNTTAICCVRVAGCYIPPILIYKWARGCDHFKDGAPLGTVFAVNPESSYINKGLFLKWLTHFVETVKPTVSLKMLLL